MYDEIINNISYGLSGEGLPNQLLILIFKYCGEYAISFFGFLGVMLGIKFLKDSFR